MVCNLGGAPLATYNSSSTSYNIPSIPTNSSIILYVSATNNQNATSPTNSPYTIQTNVPDAPTLNTMNQYSFTWNAPYNNGDPITGYLVQYNNGNSQTVNTTSFNPSVVQFNTTINIFAVNAAGQSAPLSVTWIWGQF